MYRFGILGSAIKAGNMHFLVPTNWDRELISPLSQIKADTEIYGVLPISMMGSGGLGPDIPQMTTEQAEEYINLVHSAGLTFNYLLNAPSLSNMEWHEGTHHELLQHLQWLSNAGVESVTVAIPYLLELIKRQFPRLKVEVSTIAHVNSVARAKYLESLGADTIMLDASINRDLELLKAIRDAVDCKLGVLTNTLCLYQCPYEYYHSSTLGHASQKHSPLHGFYMDYCAFQCALNRLNDSSQFIKARWIRPEDIHIYEQIGLDFFKIGGRAMPTEWILNAAKAYASLRYKGNLHDLLNPLTPQNRYAKPYLSQQQITAMASPPSVYIDNQALEGFIDFFKTKDCLSGCGNCHYCQEVADKVVKFDRHKIDKYMSVLKKLLGDLVSSRIFQPASA